LWAPASGSGERSWRPSQSGRSSAGRGAWSSGNGGSGWQSRASATATAADWAGRRPAVSRQDSGLTGRHSAGARPHWAPSRATNWSESSGAHRSPGLGAGRPAAGRPPAAPAGPPETVCGARRRPPTGSCPAAAEVERPASRTASTWTRASSGWRAPRWPEASSRPHFWPAWRAHSLLRFRPLWPRRDAAASLG